MKFFISIIFGFLTISLLAICLPAAYLINNHKNVIPPISSVQKSQTQEIKYVGPRENIPEDAPSDYSDGSRTGFWSFSIPVNNILSRSGQPTINDFKWLKEHGWKSIIDFRMDGEYGETSDDGRIKGFNDLNFNYLTLPIPDGMTPTQEQAREFLLFVTDPLNQPVHIHCRAGIGRAGIATALYRYSIQGWPLSEALNEADLYGGLNDEQKKWLVNWSLNNVSGAGVN